MRFVEPLSGLYRCMVSLRAGARRSIGWDDGQRRARRLQRTRQDLIDTVEISAEATFRFAALKFDPHHITYDEARKLVCLLRQLGGIDSPTAKAFDRGVCQLCATAGSDTLNFPQDLIAALDRLSSERSHSWHGNSDILIALEVLRTIDSRRRALPSLGHPRSP